MISAVIPVFNEEDNVLSLYEELRDVLAEQSQDFEIIFIDDGSNDNTLVNLKKMISGKNNLRAIQLSQRFGKSAALTAGFNHIKGEIVVTLDGDGQDDPKNIPSLILELTNDFDVICGWRNNRQDTAIKKLNSKIYNILNGIFSKVRIHDNNCMLRVYRKEVVTDLSLIKGAHRYLPAIIASRGFRISEKKVSHRPRLSGKSKYGTKRLFKGFLDLFKFNLFVKKGYKEKSNKMTIYEIEEKYGFE
ncbi:MAG: glycosyltransferase family 2 protein [Candidatus Heimdallarchaeota archaeon]|nr:glycosyltransferase family 2 protein [Candidatus Heimdallarchaeota archaeon]